MPLANRKYKSQSAATPMCTNRLAFFEESPVKVRIKFTRCNCEHSHPLLRKRAAKTKITHLEKFFSDPPFPLIGDPRLGNVGSNRAQNAAKQLGVFIFVLCLAC